MTKEERALARIIFHKKVLASDGQAYEDLFVAIMQKVCKEFRPVKPQGTLGDRKNDGYDPTTGHYYQVFAPEDVAKSKAAAVAKLKADFAGLMAYWNGIYPLRRFSFVFNDKFKGSYPTIETDLAEIGKSNSLEGCDVFLAKNLEDVLFSLPDDEILAITGFVPDPDKITDIDYSVLNDVIAHIRSNKRPIDRATVLAAPNFDAKIKFNGLSEQVAHLLNSASYQVGAIDQYFSLNSEYAKQEIRDHLASIYTSTRALYDTNIGTDVRLPDVVFFEMLEELAGNSSESAQSAALVVMAYFFEACDIFERPQ